MIDRVNEKLYDEFMDTVLADDGGPMILADYVDDLKGVLLDQNPKKNCPDPHQFLKGRCRAPHWPALYYCGA